MRRLAALLAIVVSLAAAGVGSAGDVFTRIVGDDTATAPQADWGFMTPGDGVMKRRVACLAVSCLAACAAGMGAAAPTNAQLAGQRVVWTIDGTTVSTSMPAAIRRGEAGSVILFTRNASTPAGLRRLTGQLQAIPRPRALDAPLLVMVDQEGGLVRRLRWAPPAMSGPHGGAPHARRHHRSGCRHRPSAA